MYCTVVIDIRDMQILQLLEVKSFELFQYFPSHDSEPKFLKSNKKVGDVRSLGSTLSCPPFSLSLLEVLPTAEMKSNCQKLFWSREFCKKTSEWGIKV